MCEQRLVLLVSEGSNLILGTAIRQYALPSCFAARLINSPILCLKTFD